MDIAKITARVSEQMGIPLELRDRRHHRGEEGSSLQIAEVFHNGEYYGFMVLATNENGEIKSCGYSGKHPVLAETGDWREELGMSIERDEKGLFRVDTNQAPFLDFEAIDHTKLSEEENKRRMPYVIGSSYVGCLTHNHRLLRRRTKEQVE